IDPVGPISICDGTTQILTATTPDLANIQWFRNGQSIAGANSVSFEVSQSGNYTLTSISSITGCAGTSAPVSVTVNPIPTTSISANGALTFCVGDNVLLTAVVTGATAQTFTWEKDGLYLSDLRQITATETGI